ncbi:MAG TPA: carbohydrate ABC transporter permease [Clostridiales bacterium]|nr:carbohydrate ABC transporter permease [Clostridiales bacterium]
MKLKKKSIGGTTFDILNYTFMVLFSLSIIYPFWNLILLSFSDQREATNLGFRIWINNWDTTAYKYIFEHNNVAMGYFNTIFRAFTGTVLMLIMCYLGAYPLSKKNLPGRNIITIFFLITMFFSGGLIPSYLLIKKINLMDKRLVYIIPGMFSTYNMIIMRNFIMSMNKELEEAALIDGANYFDVAFKVIAPLLKPVLATIALWSIVGHWNSWFDCLIYIKDEKKYVLQLIVRRIVIQTQGEAEFMKLQAFNQLSEKRIHSSNVKSAVILVTIGPIVLIYPFLQKYFVKGIMVGSLKG